MEVRHKKSASVMIYEIPLVQRWYFCRFEISAILLKLIID